MGKNAKSGLHQECAFRDEAGFILHTQRKFSCILMGTPAKDIVLHERSITISMLGVISVSGGHRHVIE
jgi:hypothetical protein